MVSASKTTSWAVATGVAAVEALKDQVGLCRWNYAIRSVHQHAKTSFASSRSPSSSASTSSSSSSKVRKLSSGAVENARGSAVAGAEAARRAREAEKAETVMLLVCWGPN